MTDPRQMLDAAFQAAQETIAATPDGRGQFRLATELAAAYRRCADALGRYRGTAADRIVDEEALSLRGLADELGVSHQRLYQLRKEARQ